MDWKRERDALIAQTNAFVQSVTGKREASERAAEVRLEGRLPRVTPLQPPLEVSTAPVEAASPLSSPIEPLQPQSLQPQSLPTPSLPSESMPLAAIKASEPPRVVRPVPLGIQNEVKSEIEARIANFRAHQDRFNRERAEYFSATLARLRASLEQSTPRRSGQIIEAREPLNGRSSPGPATNRSETPADSRSSGNGRGPS
jgi:hypothetical protein